MQLISQHPPEPITLFLGKTHTRDRQILVANAPKNGPLLRAPGIQESNHILIRHVADRADRMRALHFLELTDTALLLWELRAKAPLRRTTCAQAGPLLSEKTVVACE